MLSGSFIAELGVGLDPFERLVFFFDFPEPTDGDVAVVGVGVVALAIVALGVATAAALRASCVPRKLSCSAREVSDPFK